MKDYNNISDVQSSKSYRNTNDSGVTKWRMETAKDIDRFLKHLEGKETSDNGKTWYDSKTKFKVCGHKGIMLARSILEGAISHSTLQSNLTYEMIEQYIIPISDDLSKIAGIYYKNYQINRELAELYVLQIIGQIRNMLTRALEDKEREHAVTQSKENVFQRMTEPISQFMNSSNNYNQSRYL